jgi:hypothetical protein
MVDIQQLKEADKGRWVKIKHSSCKFKEELGRIKSHNEYYIFVVFNCDDDWENYADYTAEAVNPDTLEFVEEEYGDGK